MSGQLEVAIMDAAEARTITDQVKTGIDLVWHQVARLYIERGWDALGYASWDDYTTREFGTSRLRLPREERAEVVASLRDSGLSIRAIAAATGDSYGTVRNALSGEQNCSPEPERETVTVDSGGGWIAPGREIPVYARTVIDCETGEVISETSTPTITGVDGKNYPAKTPQRQQRRPALPQIFQTSALEAERVAFRIRKYSEDDRFQKNAGQIATDTIGTLTRARDALSGVITQLEGYNN